MPPRRSSPRIPFAHGSRPSLDDAQKTRRSQRKVLIFESEIVDRAAETFPDVFEKYGTSALFALRAIAHRINDETNDWLAPLGINAAQYNHLVNLRFFDGGSSLNTLSSHVHTTNANVSIMINALVADGLVARRSDPNDGRSVLVRLTPKGRALADRAIALHHRHLNAVLANVSIAERRTLLAILTKLAQGLERHAGRQGV